MFGNDINIYGVKRNEMRTLILEIMSSRDKIAKLLDSIELDFYNCRQYYKTADGELMIKKMNSVSSEFKGIIDTINSYIRDLEFVMNSYQKSSDDAATLFQMTGEKIVDNNIPGIKSINVINTSNKWNENTTN